MPSEILNIIAPVFVVAGIGFFLEFRGIGFQSESLTRLVMLIGTPSLVFSSLTSTALPDDSLGRIVAISSDVLTPRDSHEFPVAQFI